MPNQDVKKNEQQGQQEKQVPARASEQGGVMRRSGYDPFLSLMPGGMFPAGSLLNLNPFSLLRRMTEEMDSVFGQLEPARAGRAEAPWTPAIEVYERDNNYVVQAELAGVGPEDVKVEMTNDAIIIRGGRKSEREETRGGVYRSERRYGQFYRSIPLPEGANAEQARAQFDKGVLEISVPMAQQQPSRREIPIETAAGASAKAGAGAGAAAAKP